MTTVLLCTQPELLGQGLHQHCPPGGRRALDLTSSESSDLCEAWFFLWSSTAIVSLAFSPLKGLGTQEGNQGPVLHHPLGTKACTLFRKATLLSLLLRQSLTMQPRPGLELTVLVSGSQKSFCLSFPNARIRDKRHHTLLVFCCFVVVVFFLRIYL